MVDDSPIGQTAQVAVVDEEISCQFACRQTVLNRFVGEVGIDGIEIQSAFVAVAHCIIKQLPLANGPEDDEMMVLLLE